MKLNKISKDIYIKIDFSKLENVQKALLKQTVIQIGIMGGGGRSQENASKKATKFLTNAEIGAIHEQLGGHTGRMPQRSFLAMPLTNNMPKENAKINRIVVKGLTENKFSDACEKIGVMAKNIVAQAFAVEGPGWQPLKNPNKKKRKSSAGKIMYDTGQLKQSIINRTIIK